MKRRAVQWIAVLVFAAIAGAATHQALTRGRALDASRAHAAAVDAAHMRADAAMNEIAAAERGYVAPGQGIDFWAGKVSESLAAGKSALAGLRLLTSDAAALAHLDSAASRLEDFAAMDARAVDYAGNGQRGMASDLIFADGYEILGAARADAAAAASAEHTAAGVPANRDRQVQLASIGALAACALLAAILLMRGPRTAGPVVTLLETSHDTGLDAGVSVPVATRASMQAGDDNIGTALDANLDGLPEFAPVEPSHASSAPAGMPAFTAAVLPVRSVNLEGAADVCVDLARLLDGRDLQAVLARTADVLGADGLIVWSADSEGFALSPALTHGYPAALVARLGSLPIDSDNATAAAWRAQSAQVVTGALAVPLLTGEGCVGVLAVELKEGRERASDVQSLARILAAQLAAIVTPAGGEGRRAAEA
ncbi:MAG: hypothetical protein M3R55_02030 [Acidobacteriota bacterium]|nr:hypothetical protein [Acidobacteriota bacterium]